MPVPEVLAVSDDPPLLVLEWIDEGRPNGTTEADLGIALASLHRAGAPTFGREDRRTTGSRGLPNEPCPDWATFYATQRLTPLARLAREAARIAGVRARRASSDSTLTASARSAGPTSHPPASTATCGPATASSTPRDTAGSSTPQATVATESSTSP